MVQLTLPANSKVKPGKDHGGAPGAKNVRKFSISRLRRAFSVAIMPR